MVAKAARNDLEQIWHVLGDPSLSLKKYFTTFFGTKEYPVHDSFPVSVHFPSTIDLISCKVFLLGNHWYVWVGVQHSTYTDEFTQFICLSLLLSALQFVSDGDPSYVLASMAQVMAPEGKISYGICFQNVFPPIGYVLENVTLVPMVSLRALSR